MSTHRRLYHILSIVVVTTMLFSGVSLPSASAQSGNGIERQVNPQTGKVSFIGPENGQELSASNALGMPMRPQDPAMALAKRFGPEFGLKNPEQDLLEIKKSQSESGRITARYQQNYQGIPVIGGELIINTNRNGDLYSMNGEVANNLSLSTRATIPSEQAKQTALQAVAKWYQKTPKDFTASEPEIWIYDESLLRPSTRPAELVWRLEVTSTDSSLPVRELVLINAQKGRISLHFNQTDAAWSVENSVKSIQDSDTTRTPLTIESSMAIETPKDPATSIPAEETISIQEIPAAAPEEFTALAVATWYVATTGNDANSCSISTSPCLTIDGAISKASTGDVIRVASGTYTNTAGNVVNISKGITLSGGWNNTFSSQSGASIIDGGGVRNGILIDASGATVVVEYFVIQNSYTGSDSGGIYLYGANFTLKNSSVINNHAGARGAGIFMIADASLTLLNSTISGNNTTSSGGGIYAVNGTVTINNSTIAYNTSSGVGGGITRESATVSIKNSIVAKNIATTNGSDCFGSIGVSDHNIIGTTAGCTITSGSGDKFNVDPVLSVSLAGTPPLHRLQPASPAINAGDNSTCMSTDQRGVARPYGSACDMGAYEFGTETGMFLASGSDQSADPGAAFALPLTVYLLDNSGNPVSGATITFTAPSSGASGTFTNSGARITTAVTNSNGYATSAIFTANNQLGEYAVTAAGGGFSATFTLRNSAADYYVSSSGSDSNSCKLPAFPCKTINATINKAIDGDVIYIATGVYTHTDAVNHVVYINSKSVSLYGGWNASFTAQTGYTVVDGEKQYGGFSIWGSSAKTINLDHFHIRNGKDGGIYLSSPSLIITNSAIYNNFRIGYTLNGGGVYIHSGKLTARNITISNNTTSGQGGGIYSYNGSYNLNNVTITGNTADSGGGLVGSNAGQPITHFVKNSILFGNKARMGSDCVAEFLGMDHTIIGNTTDCTVPAGNGNKLNVDPKLGTFLEEVGYQPLLTGSPAINAGANCFGTADQRGVTRVGVCDFGAYEFDPFGAATRIVIARGNSQRTAPNFPFVLPLYVAVLDNNGSPLNGQNVTFTSPASGASAIFPLNGTKLLTVTTGLDGTAVAEVKANQLTGSYTITASASVGSVSLNLENFAWYVSNSGNDSNSCSAPAQACATINGAITKASSGDTIFVAAGTYTSAATEVVAITKNVTLEGGWNSAFTTQNGSSIVDGQKARVGIFIAQYVTTTIRRFTIQNGRAYQGGGVQSNGTSVTMEQTIVKDSVADNAGGGIYSDGALILNQSSISNNYAKASGGGIKSMHLIATNSAVFNNATDQVGGGILASGNVNLSNVTISHNIAHDGGGLYAAGAGDTATVLNNVTISNNTAEAVGGGIKNDVTTVKMQNSILGYNLGSSAPDCSGNFVSQGYNIIKVVSGCTITPKNGDQFNMDPQAGIFLPVPGVLPVLPGSPAIDHGNPATCFSTDQRGMARVGICDIGAYEYTTPLAAANIIMVGGDKQRTPPNYGFLFPLQIGITDVNGSPVSGITVTFTAPSTGPSAVFQNDTRTITLTTGANGVVTTTFKANNLLGGYSVTASASVGSKVFNLENAAWYVSPSGNDSNSCASPAAACATINGALSKAFENDTIFVANGTYTGTGQIVVSLNKDIILSGGWNASFNTQNGFSIINGQDVRSAVWVDYNVMAHIENFIVEHSGNYAIQRGAISNEGTLTLTDCEIRENSSEHFAGGITNRGQLTLDTCSIIHNSGSRGGGIYNQGTLSVKDSFIAYNSAGQGGGIYNTDANGVGFATISRTTIMKNSSGEGGGIYSLGTIRISNAAIYSNSAELSGGGLYSYQTAIVDNVSIVANKAVEGGGILSGGGITLSNVTLSNNVAFRGGGIFVEPQSINTRLQNTIVASNSASKFGPDCSGTLFSFGYNILGNTSSCVMAATSGDRVNINPQLGMFLPTEGYVPLLPTSPAVNGGNPTTCYPTDQRGITRPQGAKCDIGAYEYTVPGAVVRMEIVGGSEQLTLLNTKFRRPLQLVALDAYGSPVSGVSIKFQAPLTSPSGAFAETGTNEAVLVTNSGGIAQPVSFSADGKMGTYNVIASTPGLSSRSFSLHNGPWLVVPVSSGGNDSYDCMNLGTACASLGGVLSKDTFQDGDPIWMSVGTFGDANDQVWIDIEKAANVSGGWNENFTNQVGTSVIQDALSVLQDPLQIYPGPAVIFQRLTVQNTGAHGIANASVLIIKESTVRNNPGTGIVNSGRLTLRNSTITQNGDDVIGGAAEGRGGVFNSNAGADPDANITILSSTITKNKGDTIGGVTNYSSSKQPIKIQNSIIAGNISLYGFSVPDCSGKFISNGYNIVGQTDISLCEAAWQSTDQIGSSSAPVNPLLDALQDFGNNVWVQPLKLGSPAIDAGPWNCDSVDQRGVARPQGGTCDIGAFEYVFNHNTNNLLITTYSAGNTFNTAKIKVCDQIDLACAAGDAHAKAAHKYATGAYNFYRTIHNRNSLDGNGIEILSTVHYGSNYKNAFWNGHMMVYGDGYGFALADDVVAHEFTHGVTQYESNLLYFYQSGAINESFSDLWGEYYDQTNGQGNDAANVKWLIGEDVTGQGATRSMSNPPGYSDPDKMSSTLYYEGMDDNGGIHTNSGINNKAVYLMVNGGAFNGKTVTALSWDKTAAIYYEVNSNLLFSGADYSDLYYALQQACSNLIGQKGITTGDCTEVKDAMDAVEMNGQPAPNFNPYAPVCTMAGTIPFIRFADDLENGISNWSFSNGTYFRWQWDSPYGPYAPSDLHSLYADDYPAVVTDASARVKSILIPDKAYLHFTHAYEFETDSGTYFDGGVLEYSLNSGSTWLDAGSLIDYNGYKGKIYQGFNDVYYDNPLKDRSAFVGSSHGYTSTRLNLASLAGKTVSFRWRIGLDLGGSAWGWWVDNIKVYTCGIPLPSTFNKTAPSQSSTGVNLSTTLSWSSSTNAASYQYCYDTLNDNQCNRTWNSVSANSVGIANLGTNTTYYWQVRAINASGITEADGQSWGSFATTSTLPVGLTQVETFVGIMKQGKYSLGSGQSLRESYIGLNNGPVKIASTSNAPLIGAERLIYKVNNVNTSFTEMMGLPNSQLDTTYWLPWYNNIDLDTQLRFANVSGSTATVHVLIGGVEMTGSPFLLEAGESTRQSFAGINNGPVEIISDQNIVAAERLIYKVNKVNTSFTEMMALPNSSLDTTYWLPWYNNADLDTQLRIANTMNMPATVQITIGGVAMPPLNIAAGESTRVSYAGVNAGPVKIVSDQNIVAAERLIYKVNKVATSFTEMMALPSSSLDTTYWLPWYNNADLDTQLRFANTTNTPASVHIYIGGIEMAGSPFTLQAGESTRQNFAGINNGPVQLVSDVPIVAAERLIYKVNKVNTSFSEMMALPNSQLDTTYWLPWYNNVDLDTQLRFGVP